MPINMSKSIKPMTTLIIFVVISSDGPDVKWLNDITIAVAPVKPIATRKIRRSLNVDCTNISLKCSNEAVEKPTYDTGILQTCF